MVNDNDLVDKIEGEIREDATNRLCLVARRNDD
jgi:hypothetical protein